ncbi:MAG: MGMT family protein [Candidatus Aenigmarchaeota archaeon]|nr:MGMT family protein [Candidatus Aenigmarchaeota archaeon]
MNFSEKVFKAVKRIPKGSVSTYSEIAEIIGNPDASRAVGNALNKNPTPIIVPCHRVVRSDGKAGGFAKGTKKKIELLRKEGIEIKNNKIDLEKFGCKF